MNKEYSPYIARSIVERMRERGYNGPNNISFSEATKWLLEKYNAWLCVYPRYVTPLENFEKSLMWGLEARCITHEMAGDGYCAYIAINQSDNPYESYLEDADIFGIDVDESYNKYYNSPEDAICAGMLRVMLWLEPLNSKENSNEQ